MYGLLDDKDHYSQYKHEGLTVDINFPGCSNQILIYKDGEYIISEPMRTSGKNLEDSDKKSKHKNNNISEIKEYIPCRSISSTDQSINLNLNQADSNSLKNEDTVLYVDNLPIRINIPSKYTKQATNYNLSIKKSSNLKSKDNTSKRVTFSTLPPTVRFIHYSEVHTEEEPSKEEIVQVKGRYIDEIKVNDRYPLVKLNFSITNSKKKQAKGIKTDNIDKTETILCPPSHIPFIPKGWEDPIYPVVFPRLYYDSEQKFSSFDSDFEDKGDPNLITIRLPPSTKGRKPKSNHFKSKGNPITI